MKKMTCRQLGGACDTEFSAETFEEMAELSKNHAAKMIGIGDEAHIKAMNDMMELMKNPEAVEKWFEQKKKDFKELEEQ